MELLRLVSKERLKTGQETGNIEDATALGKTSEMWG